MLLSRFIVGTLPVGLMVLGAGIACGQDYPVKVIRIVTSGAGGESDFASRLIAQGLTESFGQPVIIENRPGVTSTEAVSAAAPDGYTLLVTGGAVWMRPLMTKVSYDPVRDLAPITQVSMAPSVVAVHPSVPAKSIKELIALAKAKPGALNYAMTTIGGSTQLAVELINSRAGVSMVPVPYKTLAAAITAVVSGEVQLTINDASQVMPQMKSGKLRGLAVTSAEPTALVPGLPTVAASGLPGYEWVGRSGMWAPAKTSKAIVDRLNRETVRVLNRAEVKEKFLAAGIDVGTCSPEEFAAIIKSEMAKTSKLIKDAGIKVE